MLNPYQKILSSTFLLDALPSQLMININLLHKLKLILVPMCGDDFGVKMSCSGARQRRYASHAQWSLIP